MLRGDLFLIISIKSPTLLLLKLNAESSLFSTLTIVRTKVNYLLLLLMMLEVKDTGFCAGARNAVLRFQFPITLLEALVKPQFLMDGMDEFNGSKKMVKRGYSLCSSTEKII